LTGPIRGGGIVALLAVLIAGFAAAPGRADTMFVMRSPVGGLDRNSGPVERYDVSGPADTPRTLSTFSDASFYQPCCFAFAPSGELFVVNRGDTVPQPDPNFPHGSITRFLDPTGSSPTQNGTIESSHFDLPEFAAFRGSELFVAQAFGTNVLRFDIGSGSATFNGEISAGLCCQAPRGAAISPSGELFVTQCCAVDDIHRYLFDSSGNAVPNGVITGNGLSNPHDMAFSRSGELFVADGDGHAVSRFKFDSAGNAIPNGTITGLQRPIGLDFSPKGELWVADFETRDIYRFVFDRTGFAIPNGTFQTPASHIDLQFFPQQTPPPSLAATVMADRPVSYWRLGEVSGTFARDAMGRNDGTYVPQVFLRAAGVDANDSAVQLDGSTGHVHVPDSASLDTGDRFSLELWLKRRPLSSSVGTEGLFLKGYQVFLDGGKVVLRKPNVDRIAASTTAITDTRYHHVVITKSGPAVHIYIDGVDRTGAVSNQTISDTPARDLEIGAGGGLTFRGFLDEVAVYNYPLTPQQVARHFNVGL
jgi:hypothetical protein